VLAELEWVDLFIRLEVDRARKAWARDEQFPGHGISDDEVDSLTRDSVVSSSGTGAPLAWSEPEVARAFGELTTRISARVAVSIAEGVPLRVVQLATHCELDRLDWNILLVVLAPEIDLRYERLFAYLHDDATKRWPTVELVLNLISHSLDAKLDALERFTASAALMRHRVIEFIEEPNQPTPPLLARGLRLDARIARFLLDSDAIDPRLGPFVRHDESHSQQRLGPVSRVLQEELARSAVEFANRGRLLVYLRGPRGVGKKTWAHSLATRVGLGLLVIDGEALAAAGKEEFEACAQLALREAALQHKALYWEGLDVLLADDRRVLRLSLLESIGKAPGLRFIAGTEAWPEENGAAGGVRAVCLDLPRPGHAERVALWLHALGNDVTAEIAAELPVLTGMFRFTVAEIQAAATRARERAQWSCPDNPCLRVDELYASCRAQSNAKLATLAKQLKPCYTWQDLVLPADSMRQLREICDRVRYRAHVFEQWGFGNKLSLGKGLSALFSGASGTGKTMAAETMAHELGLSLYKIDLSGVVSKYIGETEKNLAHIFAEAETTSAILFFDEADALFGKRSEVKDAHDRYANVETSYLLQRMEEYEGITILATNLRRNMDEAFLRRLAFVVQFPMPDEPERLRIWNGVFPAATPQDADVDFAFMARQFKLSGGNIKNVALAAAFLAASDGSVVSMVHLVRATRRELAKMGKNCAASEFGEYATLLEG